MNNLKSINNKNKFSEEFATEQNISTGSVDEDYASRMEKLYREKEAYESRFVR